MSIVDRIWTLVREHFPPTPRKWLALPASIPFQYIDYNGQCGACWLRLYRSKDRQLVIAIVTDLSTRISQAASVTNCIEIIVGEISARLDFFPSEFLLAEHYDWRGTPSGPVLGAYVEHFHQVDLTWDEKRRKFHSPLWTLMSKEEVENSIQGSLEDDCLQRILRLNWRGPLTCLNAAPERSSSWN